MSEKNNSLRHSEAERAGLIEPISPNNHRVARCKAITISVIACLLIALLPLGIIASSMLGAFGPQDINATYESDDLLSVLNKLNLKYLSDQGSNYSSLIELVQEEAQGRLVKDLNYGDFKWNYSDYKLVEAELTEAELQALICEASPFIFWSNQLQVKISKKKSIELSALLKFDRVLNELFPQEKAEVPVSGLKQISIYLQAKPTIYENQLELNTEEIKIGPLQIIENSLLDQNAVYLERVYTIVPELAIHSLHITSRGTMNISMTIPQTVKAEYNVKN